MASQPEHSLMTPTDTNRAEAVTQATVERNARILRESLTRCRRDVSTPLRDEHVRNLIKRIEHDRAHPCEHFVTLMYDAYSRGGSRAMVEAPARAMLAMVGEWYEANAPRADLATLLRLAKQAEVEGDVIEIEIALNPSPKTIADGAEVLRREIAALEQLASTCERKQFEADARRMVA